MKLSTMITTGVLGGGAKYATLPQYLLQNPGTELDNFSAVSSWTVDLGSAVDNTTEGEFRSGTGSIKMTTADDNGSRMSKSCTPFTVTTNKRIRLYVYLYAADIANLDRIYVALRGSTWSNYIQATWVYNERAFHVGWNCLEAFTASETGTGWATTFSLARVWVVPKTGTTVNVSVDSLYVGMEGYPALIIAFDDAAASIYSVAYPLMQTYRARGTFYINTDLVGDASQVTAANLVEMDAAGWCIGNHSDNADVLTGLTAEQVTTKLTNAATALSGFGVGDNRLHMSYPSTVWDETVLTGARAAGILTARRGPNTADTPAIDANGDNLLLLPTDTVIQAGVTVSAIQARIDLIVSQKKLAIMYMHNLVTDITPSDFGTVLAYARSKGVPMITIEDVYNSLSGPVRVRV